MKNTLLIPLIIVLGASGLIAQSNTKQIGQFAWTHSVQDSVSIEEVPFIETTIMQIPNNSDKPFSVRQTYIISPVQNSVNTKQNVQVQPYDSLIEFQNMIITTHPMNDVIDVGHDIK